MRVAFDPLEDRVGKLMEPFPKARFHTGPDTSSRYASLELATDWHGLVFEPVTPFRTLQKFYGPRMVAVADPEEAVAAIDRYRDSRNRSTWAYRLGTYGRAALILGGASVASLAVVSQFSFPEYAEQIRSAGPFSLLAAGIGIVVLHLTAERSSGRNGYVLANEHGSVVRTPTQVRKALRAFERVYERKHKMSFAALPSEEQVHDTLERELIDSGLPYATSGLSVRRKVTFDCAKLDVAYELNGYGLRFEFDSDRALHCSFVGVPENQRGKGHGRALVRVMEMCARQWGSRSVIINDSDEEAFWKKFGYMRDDCGGDYLYKQL